MLLSSCLTVNTAPPDDWLYAWDRCYHLSQCDVLDMVPWIGTDDSFDKNFIRRNK